MYAFSGENLLRRSRTERAGAVCAVTPDRPYMMTMPEPNHSRKITERATPSHRWRKISKRLRMVVGRSMTDRLVEPSESLPLLS